MQVYVVFGLGLGDKEDESYVVGVCLHEVKAIAKVKEMQEEWEEWEEWEANGDKCPEGRYYYETQQTF